MQLDLSAYQVPFERFVKTETGERKLVKGMEDYPIREEIYELLRIPGLFKDGIQVVDAVMLGRKILDCKEDSLELDKDEEKILKTALNKLIARDHNPQAGQVALGGPRYEELILRVFRAGE